MLLIAVALYLLVVVAAGILASLDSVVWPALNLISGCVAALYSFLKNRCVGEDGVDGIRFRL